MTKIFYCAALAIIFSGCPSQKPLLEEIPPPQLSTEPHLPKIIISVGSLNLAKHDRKIETRGIENFSEQIRRDSIDILLLQGITRYPTLKNRADVVDGIAKKAEMRKVFGETITLSGRQNGNAVFSVYPVRSSENRPYDRLRSPGFESAVHAVVDCGLLDIVVISTLIPENGDGADNPAVAAALGEFNDHFPGRPVIVGGNLPESDEIRSAAGYDRADLPVPERTPGIWFSGDGLLDLISQETKTTVFGNLTVVRFGLYR